MTERRIELQTAPDIAWQRLQSAFSTIGKVKKAADGPRSLTGKARYGLSPVRLRISVLSGPSSSSAVLDIQARSQGVWGDVWCGASRRVIDRLVAALDAEAP